MPIELERKVFFPVQRKQREDTIASRATYLEKENALLRAQLSTIREEKNSLQAILFIRRRLLQRCHQQQQQQRPLIQGPEQVFGLLMLEQQQRLQREFRPKIEVVDDDDDVNVDIDVDDRRHQVDDHHSPVVDLSRK